MEKNWDISTTFQVALFQSKSIDIGPSHKIYLWHKEKMRDFRLIITHIVTEKTTSHALYRVDAHGIMLFISVTKQSGAISFVDNSDRAAKKTCPEPVEG